MLKNSILVKPETPYVNIEIKWRNPIVSKVYKYQCRSRGKYR